MPTGRQTDIAEARLRKDAGSGRPISPNMEPLWSLHYLRAVAALGVVLFHSLADTPWHFELGAAGIHLFFTISGFVIWTSTCRSPPSPKRFAMARVRRIVPLYWVATLIAILSTFVMPGYFWQATTRPVNVLTSLLFVPHEAVSGGVFPVLYQGWTLQYEMYFYALFCICLLLPVKLRTSALCGWVVSAVAIGAILDPPGAVLQTYTNPVCLEFVAGVVAAQLLSRHGAGTSPARWLALAFLGAVTFLSASAWESQLGWTANLLIPLGAAATIVGMAGLERSGSMFRSTWLRRAGEASYSTYLFQTLGFALVSAVLPHVPAVIRVILFVVSAQACGMAIAHYVEVPLLRLFRARPGQVGLEAQPVTATLPAQDNSIILR
jgi:exopolysaccharide production protein ExoZ